MIQRRYVKLNEHRIPIYVSNRRVFLTSEDPSLIDPEPQWDALRANTQFGIITISEARDAQGLPPVSWGDNPWMPTNQVQPT